MFCIYSIVYFFLYNKLIYFLLFFFRVLSEKLNLPEFLHDRIQTNFKLTLNDVKLHQNWKGGERRFLLILKAFVSLCKEDEINKWDYIECSTLFWRTISDPRITMDEMTQFLRVLFGGCHLVQQLSDSFGDLYPECYDPYEPRTLLHLSRCKARDTIIKSRRALPYAVSMLNIPQVIKTYILANSEEDR